MSEIFMLGLLALNNVRYLETHKYNITKSQYWYNNILPSYDDSRFKKIMRMFPESFKMLVNLLNTHSIFQSNNVKQQAPVKLQLVVFLKRLGSKEDVFSLCLRYEIAESTMILYCRELVHARFEAIGGIEDTIGAIDGTYFTLQNAPQKDKFFYFTRKKRYALHCQGIVDHRGIFISYDMGWPALIYPLSPFLIKPFNKPNKMQAKFNCIFSSHRIVVEHAFGLQNDVWKDYDNNNEDGEDNNNFNDDSDKSLRRAGEAKRDWIMRNYLHFNLFK
ncbi:unnamed protein product [Rhizophagus irregularis]|nr:unnamed protein product [Rhizophagus irregularis]